MANAEPQRVAERVLEGFESYFASFRTVTRRARRRFERRDWQGGIEDAAHRLTLQSAAVGEVLRDLEGGIVPAEPTAWAAVRDAYGRAIERHPNRMIAETFYNSVVRRILGTVGKSVETEFDAPALTFDAAEDDPPVCRAYAGHAPTATRVERILRDCAFDAPFRDVAGDAVRAAARIDAYLLHILGSSRIDAIDVLEPVFFRQTLAYLVGRIRVGAHVLPLVVTLRHDDDGIAVDAVLLTQDELSIVFSFTRSHFQADLGQVRDVVRYLKGIMPLKPIAELLISVGFYKTGKTEMYRALRDHLATTIDRFEFARGAQGMVMLVFTLPFYGVVFKIIRDRFAYPKTATRQDVLDRYHMVFAQDRAGRMVEAQEFEGLELPRERFRDDLLRALLDEAADTVRLEGDTVVLDHVYLERKVWPLDLYVREGPPEAAPGVVLDYGQAIKDLARVNVFPGDFLLKNFGVTRHRRVVFYDYDEIGRITDCNFRAIPPARNPEDELSPDPWYTVSEGDVFPEEFERFLGLPRDLARRFRESHGDLFGPGFWRDVQDRLSGGEVLEIRPYGTDKRLH